MRISSLCIALTLAMSLGGFKAQGKEPAEGGPKREGSQAKPAEGSKPSQGEKNVCDTQTGIQELGGL